MIVEMAKEGLRSLIPDYGIEGALERGKELYKRNISIVSVLEKAYSQILAEIREGGENA
jgi:hypothetical protein